MRESTYALNILTSNEVWNESLLLGFCVFLNSNSF